MDTLADVNWDQAIWKEINDAVVKEVTKLRTAQKVFPTTVFDNEPTEVQNEVITFAETGAMYIREGQTKPYVEIYQEFPLSSGQVSREPQLKTCKTLARMVATVLALAEDAILFSGVKVRQDPPDRDIPQIPKSVSDDGTIAAGAENGLLGLADPVAPYSADDYNISRVSVPIPVDKVEKPKAGIIYGENLFGAVVTGIAKLTAKGQAPKYALFLPTDVYADSHTPPGNQSLVTTAERIKPLVEGGFYGTASLPKKRGLLVALAGDPVGLYVGREARAEYVRKDGTRYIFKVSERFQFVGRDARALVLLKFA